jgi:hypothetical protein
VKVHNELSVKDFYSKVETDCCTNPCVCCVRFAALTPAIYGYFQVISDRELEDANRIRSAGNG